MNEISDPNSYIVDLLNESIDSLKFSDLDLISRINSVVSKIKSGELIISKVRMSTPSQINTKKSLLQSKIIE